MVVAMTRSSVVLLSASVLLRLPACQGHGWVTEPPARNAQAGPKNGYCPHCGNGNGICGDGNQWPSGSDYLNFYRGPVQTWRAGEVAAVEVKITAHHKGHFEVSICDQVLSGSVVDPQACLDRGILLRASPAEAGLADCAPGDRRAGCQPVDPRHPERFYLPPPGFSADGSNTHRFYVKVPAGLQCEACTMQWRWWSANSCIPAPDYGCFADVLSSQGWSNAAAWGLGGSCPGGGCNRCGCGEEFRNCVDITVLAASGGGVTTDAPASTTAAPTAPVTTTDGAATTLTTTTSSLFGGEGPEECVPHSLLKCINDKSSFWPRCDPAQSKDVVGPAGYEFGFYCTQEWANALNEMLSDPVIGKCSDRKAIHKLLAQVAYETGYFSTVYQPRDGGAGLIHMIPANWPVNAADMDVLFPREGQHYEQIAVQMGKDFFQSAAYGWKSVAAWFKRTNVVIPGCGQDLFDADYDEQTRCILSRVVSRQEAFDLVGACLAAEGVATPAPTPRPTPPAPPTAAPTPTPMTSSRPPATPSTTSGAEEDTSPTMTTSSASGGGGGAPCRAVAGGEAFGATDGACQLICAAVPAGAWPCDSDRLCTCDGTEPETTTRLSTPTTSSSSSSSSSFLSTTRASTTLPPTTTTVSDGGGAGPCVATPNLNRGVSDSNCARCPQGYRWWPCNEAILCTGACSP